MFSFCATCDHEADEHDDQGCYAAAPDGVNECPCTAFNPS